MKKSIGANAILNTLKTFMTLMFPLITFPYISRILQVENLGNYNFCVSIINYFSLLSGLGISTYAIREGSIHRDNINKFNKFASEVFSINIISTIISYSILIICVFLSRHLNENKQILGILSIAIIFKTIGCEWIFNIYEEFKYITIRSICFQLLSLLCLFVFVKTQADLINYAIITVLSSSGANIVNCISRQKYCHISFIVNKNMLAKMKPILIIFANSIAVTIFVNSDVTMLGVIAGDYATGLYAVSSKVYLIVKEMLSAMIIVSIPRLSVYVGEKKEEAFRNTANKVFNMLLLLVVPAVVGIFFLSRNIIMIISGKEYLEADVSLKILSLALFCCIFSWFYTSCILMTNKKEGTVLKITTFVAILNVVLNIFLMPIWKQDAAALTTLLAEGTSMVLCYVKSRNLYKNMLMFRDIISMLIGNLVICCVCVITLKIINSIIISTIVAIIMSVVFYFCILIICGNSSVMSIIEMLKKKAGVCNYI